jgi:hypothetical protein
MSSGMNGFGRHVTAGVDWFVRPRLTFRGREKQRTSQDRRPLQKKSRPKEAYGSTHCANEHRKHYDSANFGGRPHHTSSNSRRYVDNTLALFGLFFLVVSIKWPNNSERRKADWQVAATTTATQRRDGARLQAAADKVVGNRPVSDV